MKPHHRWIVWPMAAALGATSVHAEEALLADVVVTATRLPEPADRVPAAISVVTGPDLARRGVADLPGALAEVAGVDAPAGGDAGPSSAVPAFWGLHEFDAFLLVVDGVPAGGAYNPAISTLDLNNLQRVEVLKGSAPVMFGATSFVGVVQALHYPAGEAADTASVAAGSHGSLRASASAALPASGAYRQSLAVSAEEVGYADPREHVRDEHALYRGALDTATGQWTFDLDLAHVHDRPPSPLLRTGMGLSAVTPIDANFNPADARIEEDRYHAVIGYSRPTALGLWETRLSYARSNITDVRAFLHPDLSGTADTQYQTRHIDDAYLDSHLSHEWAGGTSLLVGADLLVGHGTQTSRNGNDAYTVPLDGSVVPPSTTPAIVSEIGTLDDRRYFGGVYAQADWKPDARWDLIAGVRVNDAVEHKDASDLTFPPPALDSASVSKTMVRATGTLGASVRLWQQGADELVLFADWRSAFKPAAIDFGPDYTPDLLSPETAQGFEVGAKGTGLDGRVRIQAEAFQLDFHNLVVPTLSGALANAAGERLRGLEVEAHAALAPALSLTMTAAYHDATYTSYDFVDGDTTVSVAGRQLPLSPRVLAGASLDYAPTQGPNAGVLLRYTGRRYLDEENTAPVGGYATLDAHVGWTFGRILASVDGVNLTDRRPPVSASEFGSESFYLLPGRMLWLRLAYSWR